MMTRAKHHITGLVSFFVNLVMAVQEKGIVKDALACKVNRRNSKMEIISVFRRVVSYSSALPFEIHISLQGQCSCCLS
jgi:hypothetical protein